MNKKEYIEETAAYLSPLRKQRILFELYSNALMTIRSVYMFKHFDEYITQLKADTNSGKGEVYWNVSYYEKQMDYVRIAIAFETFNKGFLLENGYIVHSIKKNKRNEELYNQQQKGNPVKISDYLLVADECYDRVENRYYLGGFRDGYQTINYSLTLNDKYQEIINIDRELLLHLRALNDKRNRLHFFTEPKGAFEHKSHIAKWRFIMDASISVIKNHYDNYDEWALHPL